jgi:integrase/recombinase XerD
MSNFSSAGVMKDLRGFLTPDQVKSLIDACSNYRDKLMLRLLWTTGCRISELVGDNNHTPPFSGLHVSSVLLSEGVIIFDTLKRRQYPPPRRRVPIDNITIAMLKKYIEELRLKPDSKLIDISRQRAWKIMGEVGEKVGINNVGTKKIHPHHLRHSHCVAWIRDNNTLEGLRELQIRLQHSNINTTAGYLQFAVGESRPKIEKTFGEW